MLTFRTIVTSPNHFLWKEKNSKFIAIALPFESEADLKTNIAALKKQYSKAGHFCYAYKIGTDPQLFRVNDDGEPNNSAGNPILGQIQSMSLTNILVVVVRFFGGTKLGVGGLISAYKTAASGVLKLCVIVEKTIDIKFKISFELKNINTAMRIIKETKMIIVSQKIDLNAIIIILCPKKDAALIIDKCKNLHEITLQIID